MESNIRTDSIYIRGLRLKCRIGTTPQERRKKRIITADIALKYDLCRPGQSDLLKDTIDYSVIARAITVMAEKKTFCLLESLAKCIAEICLANSKVKLVTVKVSKSNILANVRSVEVEITRSHNRQVKRE